jgi:hypothetical protein
MGTLFSIGLIQRFLVRLMSPVAVKGQMGRAGQIIF